MDLAVSSMAAKGCHLKSDMSALPGFLWLKCWGLDQVGRAVSDIFSLLQNVSLVTCRFMDHSGMGWDTDAVRCIEYCLSKDAQILSNSWGGVEYSEALQVYTPASMTG